MELPNVACYSEVTRREMAPGALCRSEPTATLLQKFVPLKHPLKFSVRHYTYEGG